MTAVLEICVDEPAGVAAALSGGADRLELCAGLALGGLTPTTSLVHRACLTAAGLATVHAMVRPRAGDFVYDQFDAATAMDDAVVLLAMGVNGLVFGATRDGALDGALLASWVTAVRAIRPTVELTLHRAIDTVSDPLAALRLAHTLGFDRVLTSGGAPTIGEGVATAARMVGAARDTGLVVTIGSGVRVDNVDALARATGARHFHASASRPVAADPGAAALGFAGPPRRATDADTVRALRAAIDRISD